VAAPIRIRLIAGGACARTDSADLGVTDLTTEIRCIAKRCRLDAACKQHSGDQRDRYELPNALKAESDQRQNAQELDADEGQFCGRRVRVDQAFTNARKALDGFFAAFAAEKYRYARECGYDEEPIRDPAHLRTSPGNGDDENHEADEYREQRRVADGEVEMWYAHDRPSIVGVPDGSVSETFIAGSGFRPMLAT
jgi:hypothetical protein